MSGPSPPPPPGPTSCPSPCWKATCTNAPATTEPRRPEQDWPPSCPGHLRDAPAAVPPVTSARAPARNPPAGPHPAKHPAPLPPYDAESHSVMPTGHHNAVSHGFPDYLLRIKRSGVGEISESNNPINCG